MAQRALIYSATLRGAGDVASLGLWCREEDEDLKETEDVRSSRDHQVWRPPLLPVCYMRPRYYRRDSSRCPHDAIYRGFKCSIWSSLAIWTWLFDPAASRPKNCSFNSIRRLKLIPGWGSVGVARSVRLMPAHNQWTRLLYLLHKSDRSHIFSIVCDRR